jgi:RNA polymerase sigma-70 factor (ECF subfamily)
VKVLRGVANLRDPARLRPWLFGIARRVAMDRLRRKYSQAVESEVALEDVPAPASDADLESDLNALQHGLDALPLSEREVLALFYLRELTIEQMSDLLTVPVGTIKSRLFRARELLRNELKGELK